MRLLCQRAGGASPRAAAPVPAAAASAAARAAHAGPRGHTALASRPPAAAQPLCTLKSDTLVHGCGVSQ